jgi:hypothetical protein
MQHSASLRHSELCRFRLPLKCAPIRRGRGTHRGGGRVGLPRGYTGPPGSAKRLLGSFQ